MVNILILEDFVKPTTITNKLSHPPKDKARGVVVPPHGPRTPAAAPAPATPSPAAAPVALAPILVAATAPAPAPAPATIAAATTPPAAHLLH